jgi:RiboL-PSP-HEPN
MQDSLAGSTFAQSIKDAENLLAHFDALNTQPPPPETEVLKRAGLVMAMTAWETYVEDRITEAATERLQGLSDPHILAFVQSKLIEEIKRLHNPTSEKTIRLFRDYAGVDLTESWKWNNFPPQLVRERLNEYMKLRGDVVHRARVIEPGPPKAHAVTKPALMQAIAFLKNLVGATELALWTQGRQAVAEP